MIRLLCPSKANPMTQTTQTLKTVSWQTYAILAGGVLAVSMAAIFIRLAQAEAVPSLLIAAARLGIAALILTPFTLQRHLPAIQGLSRADLALITVSGLFLALHFILWITSLEYTSVLISVVLVTTTPLWSALLEAFLLKVNLHRLTLIGLLAAISGGVLISLPGGDDGLQLGSDPLLGGALALLGAVAVAVYLVIGRKVRARLALFPYIWLVYGIATLFTLVAVALTGTPALGYSTQGYVWMVLVAVFPQLIGHSSFNYALGYLSATYVGIATQSEPIGSAVLAFIIFQEIPRSVQLIGSVVILAGVILASLGQSSNRTL
jgi:drug/metabolite transporter (DMT)-like permease